MFEPNDEKIKNEGIEQIPEEEIRRLQDDRSSKGDYMIVDDCIDCHSDTTCLEHHDCMQGLCTHIDGIEEDYLETI